VFKLFLLGPLVRAGDTILVHLVKCPHDGDLIVAAAGDRLLLGRLHEDSPQAPVIDIAALSQPVGRPIAPFRVPRENVEMKAVTGVIWRYRTPVGALGITDDVAELDSDDAIGLPNDACLFKVDGISAEPRALDGHTVIAGAWVEGTAMRNLAGKVVIAACEGEDDNEHFYFKCVRFDGEAAWLINLNADHDNLPVRVCLNAAFLPRLTRLAPVIGVLFDFDKV
jgi:SOS-response transcriptional repressor LexA